MQRLLYAIAFTLFFAGFIVHLSAQTRHSHHGWGNSVSFNSDADSPSDACDDHFNVTFDESDTFTAEESRTLAPADFAQGLTIHAAHNGGVLVRGWDKNEVLVKACKAVAADDEASAKSLLGQLKMSVNGNQVSASGPGSEHDWVVHFLVRVPRNIKLALDAHNGPINIRDVQGTVSAETVNGPVDVSRCSGDITAEATNGPVKIFRSSGNIRVRTQNGPLDVELAGTQWSGQGLDASAQNG
ncbi:MAG TPA: hypothetical protein VL382_04165, partial [Terriglobales bacterium]|nr:hypothetical protein [Terriglobales bacterium]